MQNLAPGATASSRDRDNGARAACSRPLESLRSRSLTNPGDYGQTFAPKANSSAVRGSEFRWESPIQFRLGNTSQRRLLQRLNPSLRRDDGNIERASLEYELTDFK